MHPVVYVFSSACGDISREIQACAERVHHTGGVFFLQLDGDVRHLVQALKVKIQQNEAGLNLKKVHIYVVIQAHRPKAADCAQSAAESLRPLFAEDFASVGLTLCVLLHESLEGGYEARFAAIHQFLSALASPPAPISALYDRTFLLSDRNENDTVHPSHWQLIYETIARLPLVQNTPSRIYECLEAKCVVEEKPLFLSAGILLSEAIETETETCTIHVSLPETIPPVRTATPPLPPHTIVSHMQSIAARPLHIFNVRGLTLSQAEAALYGDSAERFFMSVYLSHIGSNPPPDADKNRSLAHQITSLIIKLDQRCCAPCKAWRVSTIKRQIGEAYALRYQLYQLQAAQAECARKQEAEQNALHTQEKAEAQQKTALGHLHFAPPPPLAISLIRDDGLLHEDFIFKKHTPCLLRIAGGFPIESITRFSMRPVIAHLCEIARQGA